MSDVTRRSALQLIAAAGATVTAGCSKTPTQAETNAQSTALDTVLGMAPLAAQWQTREPFIFCVHHDDHYPKGNESFGPQASLEGRRIGSDFAGKDGWRMYHGRTVPGFPQHPHRGFETVTVVRRGLLDHSDSMGAAARYGEGDVQWLTAGKGIIHAEMFPLLEQDRDNPLELFQIWLNLPASDKFAQPHFSMLWKHTVPRHVARDPKGRTTEITIIAGRYQDLSAPSPPPKSYAARPDADVAIWTIKLAAHARWTLPAAKPGTDRRLYFFRGAALRVAGKDAPPSHLIDVRGDAAVTLENGEQESELLLLQARPIGEPVVQQGPFVMNSREEIRQAFADYRRTRFGGWPWQSDDPVHAREEGRFARHADGRIERPA